MSKREINTHFAPDLPEVMANGFEVCRRLREWS